MDELSIRELLELAAKAAGIDLVWNDALCPGYYSDWRGLPQWEYWNPLTDDGDALRLAVKCGIAVQLHPAWVYARAVMPADHLKWMEITEGWGISGDAMLSTRRAIVRAASEIGKDKP